MTVIDCFGDGRIRGRAHGEAARQKVRASIARWTEATLAASGGKEIQTYAVDFLSATGLMAAVERWLPDLAEEVRGIAEGADVDYPLVAAYNLMDERWWYDLDAAKAEPGCSLLSVRTGGSTLLAQNMDLPDFMDGSQLVLRLRDVQGAESLVLTSAGLVGLTGINRSGFAICVNTLLMLNHNPDGIPVAFVMRGALAQASKADALDHLRSLPHASGQHYAVADRYGVTSLECSAGGAVTSFDANGRVMIHTNHPLANLDVDDAALALIGDAGRLDNSRLRYATLETAVNDIRAGGDIMSLLSDATTPLCMVATLNYTLQTFASMVFELADRPSAGFCLGRPGGAAWQEVSFSD